MWILFEVILAIIALVGGMALVMLMLATIISLAEIALDAALTLKERWESR